jgi:predicted restriction endonuclease
LKEKAERASRKFNDLSGKIKVIDSKLQSNANLQKHIVTYAKTRAVYAEYKKRGYSKKFKEAHETDILLHQTAKKAFDDLGIKKLPPVASLRQEYAYLLAEKKNLYKDYHSSRSEMRELLTARHNVERLLDFKETPQGVQKNQPEL